MVILRGQKVLKVEKYDYTLHPDAKKLVTKKASKHIPKWRENGQTEEYDYLPKPQAKSQKRRAYTPSKKTKEPVLPIQDPVYQEPDYEYFPKDLLKDDWKNSSEIVPLDKNSIMS